MVPLNFLMVDNRVYVADILLTVIDRGGDLPLCGRLQ